jgi:hypothetical protein
VAAQQLARLQLEVQRLQTQLQVGAAATKDLSLVSLVPNWAGTPGSAPLSEFLESIENASRIGRWTDDDKFGIAILKLSDMTRAFFNAHLQLHSPDLTWAAFKDAFLTGFKDVRSDQFHYTQLQTARQRRDESQQSFDDRIRGLGQKIVPQVADAAQQKIYNEQAERMMLASFISGLSGTPGKQVRFSLPGTMEDALSIAITVHQAQLQEQRNDAFYLAAETKNYKSRDAREPWRRSRRDFSPSRHNSGSALKHGGPS